MFPTEFELELFCSSIGLPLLSSHLQLVLTSFFSFFFLQFLSKKTFPILFSNHFQSFDSKTKLDWDLHFVSLCVRALELAQSGGTNQRQERMFEGKDMMAGLAAVAS